MIRYLLLTITCLFFYQLTVGQTYNMSNSTVSTCSGTFYDPGGTGNYANNQNVTMTFCNTTAGQAIYANFASLTLESNFDYLYVYNGPNTASPSLGVYTGSTNPGNLTASSGCITFLFTSDGSVTYAGWQATISCFGSPPPPCNTVTNVLCGSQSQATSPNSSNQGAIGCLASTYNQTLYSIQPTTAGNITYTLTSGCDVDFALWGPFATPPCGIPTTGTIDCSFSASATEYADITNAVPGQYYILLVSNYCNVATTINLNPSGSAAAGIACSTACAISATATTGTILCNGGTSSITVTASGATTYTYAISPNPAGITLTGNVFNNVPSGNYTITTTNATNAACTTTTPVNVSQPSALVAGGTAGAILCNGGTTTITANASGGTPNYQYSLNGGAFQAGANFSGLSAGNYTITVLDANNCQASTTVTVAAQPSVLTGSVTATTVACNGGTADITVSASGGTPNYQYSLNGGAFQFSNVFAGLFAGNYTITIQDANFCQTTTSISITEPSAIVAGASAPSILCNTGSTTVTVTASGGTPNYQYGINGSPLQGSNVFTPIFAGNYTMLVEDANGCQVTTPLSIIEPNALTATTTYQLISCNGGTTDISVLASGGTPNYQYSLNGGAFQVSNVFLGVVAGNYTLTIEDANACQATTSFIITEPAILTASASATTILCNAGTSDITVAASGGTPNYQYSLNGGAFQVSNVFLGVVAGNYTITIQDVNLCQTTANVSITEPTALVIGASAPNILCNAGSTIVTVTASGGTPNYQYSINGSPLQGSNVFTSIFAGNHTMLVEDANGCQATTPISLIEPTALTASNTFSPILCNGGTSDITISASGGTPNYQYSLNGGSFQVSNVFTGLVAGNYTITVQDTNACQTTTMANITEPTLLTASASATTILCNAGTSDITVAASGGTPNYQYSLNGGAFQVSNIFSGVVAGNYMITIQDTNFCQTTANVAITEPTALIISPVAPAIACNGGTTTITVNASGATPNYQYSINGSPFQAGNIFTNIFTGNYTLSVQDANNCSASDTLFVGQPASPITVANIQELCDLAGGTYIVSFDVAGGTSPYSVSGVTGSFVGNSFTSTSIPTGSNPTINVTDNNLCAPVSINPQGNCTPAQPCNTVTGCFSASTIINGDFENFDPLNPFANFTSSYDYYDCDLGNSPCVNGTTTQNILCQYDFAVETGTPACNNTWSSNISDHTSGTGNMMLVDFPTGNVAPNNAIWCQNVNLLPNTDYCFGAYFLNLVPAGTNYTNPIFQFQGNGIVLGTTVGIPEDEQWHFEGIQFNSVAGGLTNMCLLNNNFGVLGYDLAIDDIMLREVSAGSPPTTAADNAVLCDNVAAVTIDVLANDLGPNIDPATLQLVSYPAFGVGNAVISGGQIVFTPDPSFTGATSFTYKVSNTNGCSEMATITVTKVPHPQPNITGITTFCENLTSLLDAGAGFTTYSWTIPSNTATTQTVTAALAGQYMVQVTDANACVGGDTVSVTINPLPTPIITTPSTAICQGNVAILDAGAGYSIYSWYQTNPAASALGSLQTQSVNSANIYGVIVTDANTCVGTDTITITINPLPSVAITQSPANPVCPGTTATLDASAGLSAYSWFGTTTSVSGNTASLSVTATDTYNVLATDANGCQNNASISTLFQDLIAPTIQNCPANISINTNNNMCTGTATWTAPTASDNCSVSIVQTTGLPSGSAFPLGNSTIAYTATDAGGNTATCSFTINVTDSQVPVFVNCPANIILNNDANTCGAIATWTAPSATDNCSANVVQSGGLPSGTQFPIGTSTVTYTATDAAGNSTTCSFTITVIDNEVPIIQSCPANIAVNNDPNLCSAIVNWATPTTSDNCAGAIITQTAGLVSGSTFPIGTTTIAYTATDAAGNTATCSFTVTVADTQVPVFVSCPSNINVQVGANCDALVSWNPPVATDNCNTVSVLQTQGATAGSIFGLGTTTISYVATDAAGNTATCSFTVNVTDAIAPVISGCPNNMALASDPGQCGAVATWTIPSATDNCGTANIIQTSGLASGSLFPIGTSTVVYTATDSAGNSTTCQFSITVTDTEVPTIVGCPANITLQAVNGCSSIASWNLPTATDNCSGAILTSSNNPGDVFGIGINTVTYTATDINGNTAVCTFTVTVTPPSSLSLTSVANDVTCYGGANGSASVNVSGGSGNYTYSWTSIPVQTTATAMGLSAGNYSVFVSDVNAPTCVQVASTIVTINQPQPIVATAVSLADANCNQNIGVATVSVSGGSQNFSYLWDCVPPQTTVVASGLGLGTYTVTVTDALNANCTATASVTIVGTPVPSITISPNGPLTICEGTSTSIIAAGGNSYQWLWNGLPFQVGNNLTVTQAGNYHAIAFSGNNLNGCSDTSAIVNISLNALPSAIIQAQSPTNVCEGQSVSLAVLGNGTYTWLLEGLPTGETAQTITTNQGGSYTVVVENSCGTDTSTNVIAQFNPLPIANFIILPAIATVQENVLFVDKSIDAATWSWSFGDANGNSIVQNPSYVYQEIGTYTVTLNITDAIGCAATASHILHVEPQPEIFIPNTFTPNGDGAHDEFLVSANNVKQFVSFEILDRWGNSVFITKDPTKGWNGNNKNGLACPSGTYYYMIDGIDYKERSIVHKGFLNLVR